MFVQEDMHFISRIFYFIIFTDYITDNILRKISSMIMYGKYERFLS